MPFQPSTPERKTRTQGRPQAVVTPTPRVPLDGALAVAQLRSHLDRGPAPFRKEGRGPRRSGSFSQVAAPTPVGESHSAGGPALANSNQYEPSLLAIMQQMTQIMANFQAASRPPAFKTPSMKAKDSFDGTQPLKVRSFLQSFQLFFHKDKENFSEERRKVLHATSFLIGRAAQWIEPYLYNLTGQDPEYLLNNWVLFQYQLFTLFEDPNEVRKAEAELDGLRMKEGGHLSLFIADFRSIVPRIGDWGESALNHHFRKGLASRILDQLASHLSRIDSLQYLMEVTLELDTRYK
ncbi:hypothetical protein O181_025681 [Austropuccinia psidii MF-1]|uniref:Retrotransposon gag domain-containing protein n=1 Tax=Austropuccinia psidii MF-1 TaxID=1389203 RepID=A0A9Q3GZT0_9BASI|nr:hypothetical protein [Austropuccinia psidii MF-1]